MSHIVLLSLCHFLFLLVSAFAGSEKYSDLVNPATLVQIEQKNGDVTFSFLFSDDFGTLIKKNAPNDRVTLIVVANEIGEEIWKIESSFPNQGSATVTYGLIPKGFVQSTPRNMRAPKLRVGDNYYVRVAWPWGAASFVYKENKEK